MIILSYTESDRDVAKKYFKLAFLVPASMGLAAVFIFYEAGFHFLHALVPSIVFLFIFVIGIIYHRRNKNFEVSVTDSEYFYKEGESEIRVSVSEIKKIGVKKTWSSEETYYDFYFITSDGSICSVPRLYGMSDVKIMQALYQVKPAIDITELKGVVRLK